MEIIENSTQQKPQPKSAFFCSWLEDRPKILIRKPSDVFEQKHNNYSPSKTLDWAETKNEDPLLVFPELEETFKNYSAIYFEIAARSQGSHAGLNFYLAESISNFSEEKKISLMIRTDGIVHPYLFDIPSILGGVPRDALRYLRMDPLDSLGSFYIQTLQLLPDKIAPRFDRQRCLVLAGNSKLLKSESGKVLAKENSLWIKNYPSKQHNFEYVIPFDDVDISSVTIRMATKTESGHATALIAFTASLENITNPRKLSMPIVADGNSRTYKIPASSIPMSSKRLPIRYIQITPMQEDGKFCIHQIKLCPERFQGDISEEDSRPILYLHIPKTAGNTVNQFLTKYLPRSTVLECRRPGANLLEFGSLDKYAVVTGHIGHKAVGLFKSIRPRVFTILRHPLDQLTSFYYYLKAQPLPASNYPGFECIIDLIHSTSLEEFAASEHPDVRIISENYQTWAMGIGDVRWGGFKFIPRTRKMLELAKKNLESYEAVGIQEDILNSIILLCYKLNLPLVAMPIPKVNITKQRKTIEDLSHGEKSIILKRNDLDLELYEYGRDLFQRRLAAMITEVGEDQYLRWLKILQSSK